MSRTRFISLPQAFKQGLFFILPMLMFIQSAIHAQTTPQLVTYPKVTGYVGILHPLFTFNRAGIVREADTDRFDLTEQSARLWAISAGLSVNYKNGYQQLEIGFKLYDALYSWVKYAQSEVHTWNAAL